MLAEERHQVIRALLASEGKVLAGDLAQRFGVSEDTVRRDLRELAGAGQCRKVYGGALAPASQPLSVSARLGKASSQKARLGKAAAKLVQPGQTLFIDAGTTNFNIAAALPHDFAFTVVTNAPGVVSALSDHANATLIVLGGIFNRAEGAMAGTATIREIEQVQADLFFLGGCALDAGAGVFATDPETAEVKRAMARRSRSVAIAATDEKFSAAAAFQVLDVDMLDHLVVESTAPEPALATWESRGTVIHYA